MLSKLLALTAIALESVNAARPFLEYPDTGLEAIVKDVPVGALPNLTDMVSLVDFEWAARNYLPPKNYTYYRHGVGGEWSYRNNLEVFNRYTFKPRTLMNISNIEASLNTTILGYHFGSPFFISPCARAGWGHPEGELNLVKGAAHGNVLYMVSAYSTVPFKEIAAAAAPNQTLFTHVFGNSVDESLELIKAAEDAGSKAIVWAVDGGAIANRHRNVRFFPKGPQVFASYSWELYKTFANATTLPIVLKGITGAKDARLAIEHGVRCIILSNHGGRYLDGSPSPLEVALEIYKEDPSIFQEIEVLADGGIRYGTDALRLLALGVKAVGLGRPVMFANVFGVDGIKRVMDLFRYEVMADAALLGLADLKTIDASWVNWTPNNWYS